VCASITKPRWLRRRAVSRLCTPEPGIQFELRWPLVDTRLRWLNGNVRFAPFGTDGGRKPGVVWVDPDANALVRFCRLITVKTERGPRSAAHQQQRKVIQTFWSSDVLIQESADGSADLHRVRFQCEVAGVDETDLGFRYVALPGLCASR
jgi:hypothetical protein